MFICLKLVFVVVDRQIHTFIFLNFSAVFVFCICILCFYIAFVVCFFVSEKKRRFKTFLCLCNVILTFYNGGHRQLRHYLTLSSNIHYCGVNVLWRHLYFYLLLLFLLFFSLIIPTSLCVILVQFLCVLTFRFC